MAQWTKRSSATFIKGFGRFMSSLYTSSYMVSYIYIEGTYIKAIPYR